MQEAKEKKNKETRQKAAKRQRKHWNNKPEQEKELKREHDRVQKKTKRDQMTPEEKADYAEYRSQRRLIAKLLQHALTSDEQGKSSAEVEDEKAILQALDHLLKSDESASPEDMEESSSEFLEELSNSNLKDSQNPYVKAFKIIVRGIDRSDIRDDDDFWDLVWEATEEQVQKIRKTRATPLKQFRKEIQDTLKAERVDVDKAVRKSLENIDCLMKKGWIDEQESKLDHIMEFCDELWQDIGLPPRINWTDKCRNKIQVMLSAIGTAGAS
ncbi:MAG: hypothetical protein SGILL_008932 [Bacillariaceae sp.]